MAIAITNREFGDVELAETVIDSVVAATVLLAVPALPRFAIGIRVTNLLVPHAKAVTRVVAAALNRCGERGILRAVVRVVRTRSEEHTSELQSRQYLVCRLL